MRFTIKREELLKGLNTANRAVANKVNVAILQNVKLELNEEGLFITGSNYDITIKTQIPYRFNGEEIIRNFKEGSILLEAKLLTEIVRKTESEEMTIDVVDSTAVITNSSNRSTFELVGIKAEEYPDIDLQSSGTTLSLSKQEFNSLVSQTAFAASLKERMPILTAINLEAQNGVLTAKATDSARMAKKDMPVPEDVKFVANVPAKVMIEVDHLMENQPSVQMSFSDKKVLFVLGRTIVVSRLIAGDYPDTKNIIPKTVNYSLQVNANDFIKAVDRANILSIDRENVVDLTMNEETVKISAKSQQKGWAAEIIDVFKYHGSELKMSFNSEYVVAAIKALNCEDVTFSFVAEMRPIVIKNAADDSVVQIVTPVRTY